MATSAELAIVIRARDEATRALKQVATSAERTSQSLKATSQSLMSVGRTAGIAAAAGIGAIALMAKSAAEFDTAFREVNTLVGMSEKQLSAMRDQVKGLSLEMGVDAVEATQALYQAISAGVPAENAFAFLQEAAKLGVAGVADTETAVSALTGVMNAFQAESLEAAEAADILFTTVRMGKTNLAQLAPAMGMVAPAAAAAGVSLRETSAALASVTKIIPNVNTAAAALRQVFAEADKVGTLFNKGLRELGAETMGQAIEQFGSFQEVLNAVYANVGSSDVAFKNLFGSVEGAGAALTLVGANAATAAADLQAMRDSTGAAQTAFEEMEKAASREFAKAGQVVQAMRRELGEALLPTVVAVMQKFADMLRPLVAWIRENSELARTLGMVAVAVVGATAALAAFSLAAGVAVGAIGSLIGMIGGLSGAFAALAVSAAPIYAAGGLLAGLVLLLPAITAKISEWKSNTDYLTRSTAELDVVVSDLDTVLSDVLGPTHDLVLEFERLRGSGMDAADAVDKVLDTLQPVMIWSSELTVELEKLASANSTLVAATEDVGRSTWETAQAIKAAIELAKEEEAAQQALTEELQAQADARAKIAHDEAVGAERLAHQHAVALELEAHNHAVALQMEADQHAAIMAQDAIRHQASLERERHRHAVAMEREARRQAVEEIVIAHEKAVDEQAIAAANQAELERIEREGIEAVAEAERIIIDGRREYQRVWFEWQRDERQAAADLIVQQQREIELAILEREKTERDLMVAEALRLKELKFLLENIPYVGGASDVALEYADGLARKLRELEAAIKAVNEATGDIPPDLLAQYRHFMDLWSQLTGVADPAAFTPSLTPPGFYAGGGTVPGPPGRAQMAIVHGGEEIIAAGGRGGATYVFHFPNFAGDKRDFENVVIRAIAHGQRKGRIRPGTTL